jgi:hypothetical protein
MIALLCCDLIWCESQDKCRATRGSKSVVLDHDVHWHCPSRHSTLIPSLQPLYPSHISSNQNTKTSSTCTPKVRAICSTIDLSNVVEVGKEAVWAVWEFECWDVDGAFWEGNGGVKRKRRIGGRLGSRGCLFWGRFVWVRTRAVFISQWIARSRTTPIIRSAMKKQRGLRGNWAWRLVFKEFGIPITLEQHKEVRGMFCPIICAC